MREAAQNALAALASKVHRQLAPHLKDLMGCWLTSQCDTYAPVASAAKKAFTMAFSPDKQKQVLIHCKTNILNVSETILLILYFIVAAY